jgi:DNA-binding CsgD family transcriptional regulator
VAPVLIEHPHRIEAILLCHFLAMLTEALVEREIRTSMKAEGLIGTREGLEVLLLPMPTMSSPATPRPRRCLRARPGVNAVSGFAKSWRRCACAISSSGFATGTPRGWGLEQAVVELCPRAAPLAYNKLSGGRHQRTDDRRHRRWCGLAARPRRQRVMVAAWPLTGRTVQLEELGHHFRSGASGGVVLQGPAGVGKTRLAEEALRQAERAGTRVERAVGHPATQPIPLGALAHLLPSALVDDLGVGEDERTALFHGARAELRRLAGSDRLVLLVDDLDLLDDTSVAVLVPLVVSRSVFLIGTVRTGRTPSPRLTGLQRDGHLIRLDLEPVSADELGALLHRALDGPVTARALAELARLSGGNLQALTELVRGAREGGILVEAGGAWHLTGPLPTTTALEELVAEHIGGVDAAGLTVLELLAVCGHFGLTELERVHGAATVEGLEASRLVTVVTSGRRTDVRLAHPLYGEVIRERLPPLRLRRIHQQLADVVEAHGARRREDIVQVALWRLGSGGRPPDDQLLRAARLALVGRDPALAVRLLSSASGDGAVTAGDRAEVLAEAHAMQGHDADVERVIAGVWEEPLGDPQRAHLAQRLAQTRFYGGRDLEGAVAAYEVARRRLTDREEIAALDARRATMLAGAGRPAEALKIADSVGTPATVRTRVELAAARATSLLNLGRCDEAIALSRKAAADQAELPGWLARRGISVHVVNEAHAFAYTGRYAAAREILGPAVEQARAAGAMGAWVWFEMVLAEIARDTGRAREAVQRFQAVADAAPSVGQDAALVWAHVGVAQGHLLLGQCGPAASALQRADDVGDSPIATSIATRERTRAWLDACRGDLAAARARVREVVELVRREQVYLFETGALNDLVRFGAPGEAVARLQELAGQVDGPLVQAHAGRARATFERDVGLLRDVLDRYESMDALGHAAEVAAELAELYRGRGEQRRATAAQQRAADLANRAGGVRTPVLARGAGVEPLTPRERDAALLAAGGLSSRAIGERLYLSTRTVDTHLARVYRKLGITGRAELASALGTGSDT